MSVWRAHEEYHFARRNGNPNGEITLDDLQRSLAGDLRNPGRATMRIEPFRSQLLRSVSRGNFMDLPVPEKLSRQIFDDSGVAIYHDTPQMPMRLLTETPRRNPSGISDMSDNLSENLGSLSLNSTEEFPRRARRMAEGETYDQTRPLLNNHGPGAELTTIDTRPRTARMAELRMIVQDMEFPRFKPGGLLHIERSAYSKESQYDLIATIECANGGRFNLLMEDQPYYGYGALMKENFDMVSRVVVTPHLGEKNNEERTHLPVLWTNRGQIQHTTSRPWTIEGKIALETVPPTGVYYFVHHDKSQEFLVKVEEARK